MMSEDRPPRSDLSVEQLLALARECRDKAATPRMAGTARKLLWRLADGYEQMAAERQRGAGNQRAGITGCASAATH